MTKTIKRLEHAAFLYRWLAEERGWKRDTVVFFAFVLLITLVAFYGTVATAVDESWFALFLLLIASALGAFAGEVWGWKGQFEDWCRGTEEQVRSLGGSVAMSRKLLRETAAALAIKANELTEEAKAAQRARPRVKLKNGVATWRFTTDENNPIDWKRIKREAWAFALANGKRVDNIDVTAHANCFGEHERLGERVTGDFFSARTDGYVRATRWCLRYRWQRYSGEVTVSASLITAEQQEAS